MQIRDEKIFIPNLIYIFVIDIIYYILMLQVLVYMQDWHTICFQLNSTYKEPTSNLQITEL